MIKNNSLFKDRYFQWVACTHLLVCLFLFLALNLGPDDFRIEESDDLKKWIFSGVASFSIFVIGLMALNFRSVQTARQIHSAEKTLRLVTQSNLLDSYYKHKEDFYLYMTHQSAYFESSYDLDMNLPSLYRFILPTSNTNNGYVNEINPWLSQNMYCELRQLMESLDLVLLSNDHEDIFKGIIGLGTLSDLHLGINITDKDTGINSRDLRVIEINLADKQMVKITNAVQKFYHFVAQVLYFFDDESLNKILKCIRSVYQLVDVIPLERYQKRVSPNHLMNSINRSLVTPNKPILNKLELLRRDVDNCEPSDL